ncbi:MAG: type II toxin-antitoxin system RelE family toxin [Minisyncoccota bacterium]
MAIVFDIIYHHAVVQEDIPRIGEVWRSKIKSAIEEKLSMHPDVYGKPLRRSLKGYRKLRVGDYRIVFRIDGERIKIFVIAHRSVVYEISERRV